MIIYCKMLISPFLDDGCGRIHRSIQGDKLTFIEWLVYDELRDERDEHKALCSTPNCSLAAIVMRYALKEGGYDEIESLIYACEEHALEQGWTGAALTLGENEIGLLCKMSGEPSSYHDSYEEMVNGAHIVLWTNPQEELPKMSPLRAFRVLITATVPAQYINSGHTDVVPAARLFEGVIERSTDPLVEINEKCTGIIFPNDNFATIFPHDPAGDAANRFIQAALVGSGHYAD